MRRGGRPGLLRTVGRTAVVAGTASATANAVNRRAEERAIEAQQAAAFRAGQAAVAASPTVAPAPATPSEAAPASGQSNADVTLGHLQALASLHVAEVLTDEEYHAARSRLLSR